MLPATRKVRTMFFNTKRSPRKATRQTLSTEQLEPKAMFNAAPLQAEIGFEDRLSGDYDVNDAVLQVRSSQNVTCNTGFSGGGNYICNADSIWTNGGASTLRIGGNSGPGGTTFMTGEDGYTHCMHELHFQGFTTGAGGDSIVHPEFGGYVNSLALTNHSPSLIGDSDRPGDVGTSFEGRTTSDHDFNDISLHASANPHAGPEGFMKLGDIKGEFRQTLRIGGSAGPGGSTFMTDTDGRSIIHPNYNVGEDGRSIIHPNYNVGEDGRMIVHPQFNVGEDGRMIIHPNYNVGEDGRMIIHPQFNDGNDGRSIVHPQFNVGNDGRMIIHPQFNGEEDGRSIVHPQFNDGEETLPAGTIIPHEDSHLSAKDLIGRPPEPEIAPPSPHVSDRVAVIDDSNDRIEEVVRTSSAPRLEVFARMGR